MFSDFSRDSRLLILPFSPLTLIDAIVISLFFLVLGLLHFDFIPELLLLCFLIFSFWAGWWLVHECPCDLLFKGWVGCWDPFIFCFLIMGGLRWCWYGHWSRLLIRFGLVFPRAGVIPFGRVCRLPFGRVGRLFSGRVGRLPFGRVSRLPFGKVGRLPFGRICRLPFGRVGRLLCGRVGRLPFGRVGRRWVGSLLAGLVDCLLAGLVGYLLAGLVGCLLAGCLLSGLVWCCFLAPLLETDSGGDDVSYVIDVWFPNVTLLVGILDVLFASSGVQFARGLHWWLPLALCPHVSRRNGAVSWLLGEGCGIGFFCGSPAILGMVCGLVFWGMGIS